MEEGTSAAPPPLPPSASTAATANNGSSATATHDASGSSSSCSKLGIRTATTAAATTWVEDEKSWTEYGGLTVVARMERVKGALQEGLAKCEGTEGEEAPESVLAGTIAALDATLPPELHPSLPWSALVNLVNAGLGKVGWAFPEGDLLLQRRASPLTRPDATAALRKALCGVTHWLPEKALNHTATPTVDPAVLKAGGPEPSLEEYRAMWPLPFAEGAPVLRVLGADFPQRPYQARAAGEMVADSVHWGQRKLFMNELELLTLHAAPGDTVVYAGAAPGKHIEFLADRLFPKLTFVLVDPAPFRIRSSARIRLVQGLMTDELAREYSTAGTAGEEENAEGAKRVIFVSDIRRTHASEDLILEDMLDQQRWHDILRPKVSMLKFRLPWRAGDTEYLDGEVRLQPYAKPRSTETRLLVTGHARRAWSNRVYEEQCFFFNSIVRPARHAHGVEGAALDASWDCASEVEIWRHYKLKANPEGFGTLRKAEQDQAIAELSVALTQHLEGAQGREWLRRVDWSVVTGERGGKGGGGKRRGDGRDDRDEGRKRSGSGWQGHDDRRRRSDGERERESNRAEEEDGEEGGRKRRRRDRDEEGRKKWLREEE